MTVIDPFGREIPDILFPRGLARLYRRPRVAQFIAKQFQRVYYANPERTMFATGWMGTQTVKYPTDMWVYGEIVTSQRPQLIIETGTYRGGSAQWFGMMLDLLGDGRVVTIDINDDKDPPQHPRVTHLVGSSVSDETLAQVREMAAGLERILIILDSDHSRDHVLAELRAYADFVPVGGYLIVEDTNVNGHPVLPHHGPGPYEAVHDFLAEDPRFEVDKGCEKFFLTANPDGFLRRTR